MRLLTYFEREGYRRGWMGGLLSGAVDLVVIKVKGQEVCAEFKD